MAIDVKGRTLLDPKIVQKIINFDQKRITADDINDRVEVDKAKEE